MAKYLLEGSNINWLALLALLTFVIVFSLALVMVLTRKRSTYAAIARQPLDDGTLADGEPAAAQEAPTPQEGGNPGPPPVALSAPALLFLQGTAPAPSPGYPGLLGQLTVLEQLLFFGCIVMFLLGSWAVLNLSFHLMAMQRARLLEKYSPELLREVGLETLEPTKAWWQRLYENLTDRVPIEQEGAIMLDHEYDGVRELDNNLPPWWKGVFYLSVAFAPVYIYFNHFSDYARSTEEAYAVEMEVAQSQIKAYLATQEDAVDEQTVTLLADEASLSKGGAVYLAKCAACHGQLGEGGIGPNLTDSYWLHGGDIKDIFRTIKYGVPDKGMIPWKNELRPRDMQEVASFIASLRGTDPPNAKEPQGEEWTLATSSK